MRKTINTFLLLVTVKYIVNACDLKIGLNKFSDFKEKGIYFNGEIDSSFKQDSVAQYKTPFASQMDYLFVSELVETKGVLYEHIVRLVIITS